MPVAVQSINGVQYLALRGSIQLRQEQIERLARPGVDGHGFRKLGERGTPFVLTATVDCTSLADGKTKYETARLLPAANPVAVVKDGINWGNFKVERVDLVRLRAIINMVGGLNPPSTALLTLRFILLG